MQGRILAIVETLLIGVFIFAAANLGDIMANYHKGDQIYSESEQYFKYEDDKQEDGQAIEKYTIDINSLQKINPDIFAWIYIKDTKVSYPVLQCDNNEKYLKRTYNNLKSDFGSIFLDYRNSRNLDDRYPFIYGHNTKNGSMFGSLKKYKDIGYYKEHPTISLVLEDKTYIYEIFSAYTTEVDSPTYSFTYTDDNEYQTFLNKITDFSVIDTKVKPTAMDKVITLSTCTSRTETERFVVHAKLISITPNEAPVTIDKV